MKRALLLLWIISFSMPFLKGQEVQLSGAEKELYELIMNYRKSRKLPPIPLSASLTKVAQTHCSDQANGNAVKGRCNLHSWSKSDQWSDCCYTTDHKAAQCMWDKPRELTDYKGDGFEISYSGPIDDAAFILNTWKKSSGHNQVIVNQNAWKEVEWKAIGIGIKEGHANVWFGMEEDNSEFHAK